uniref:Uncharacterized protein n=1 Tax=Arundo donax TaxID=35708 RepID=A0A0A9BWY9_ARUDO
MGWQCNTQHLPVTLVPVPEYYIAEPTLFYFLLDTKERSSVWGFYVTNLSFSSLTVLLC